MIAVRVVLRNTGAFFYSCISLMYYLWVDIYIDKRGHVTAGEYIAPYFERKKKCISPLLSFFADIFFFKHI